MSSTVSKAHTVSNPATVSKAPTVSGRIDVQAILRDPQQKRRLMVGCIIATQAREGIKTTQQQAEQAYDKVNATKGGTMNKRTEEAVAGEMVSRMNITPLTPPWVTAKAPESAESASPLTESQVLILLSELKVALAMLDEGAESNTYASGSCRRAAYVIRRAIAGKAGR